MTLAEAQAQARAAIAARRSSATSPPVHVLPTPPTAAELGNDAAALYTTDGQSTWLATTDGAGNIAHRKFVTPE